MGRNSSGQRHLEAGDLPADAAAGEGYAFDDELVKELAVLPGRPLGAIDEEGIKRTIDIMAKSYPMKQPVDPKDMYAPGFIE